MDIKTHDKIDFKLCGRPVFVGENKSQVEFRSTEEMTVDEPGLVHGGFVFGLADHAAMLAVNHPNVVLGSAEVKFLKPVVAREKLIADAAVVESAKNRHIVDVTVSCLDTLVFKGRFICFILEQHVLQAS